VLTADHGDLDGAHRPRRSATVRSTATTCSPTSTAISCRKSSRRCSSRTAKARVGEAAKDGTLRPDLRKRGAIRGVFDGRYRGEDVGQMLPGGVDGEWVATGAVNDV